MENEMESMPAIGDCKGAEDKFVKDGLLAARLLVSDHVVSRLDKVDLFFNSIKPHGSLINTDKDICQDLEIAERNYACANSDYYRGKRLDNRTFETLKSSTTQDCH